ncbi:MAG: DNA topoisomerase 3 [Clostridia bacterium]|nr:DNA topoisomerase 3 [Clostridia bacterium]
MGKTLVVAEKPSVARDIARVLKVTTRGDGCIVGEDYVITWAIGHLVTLKSPEEMDDKYKTWTYEQLPIIPEKMELKITPMRGASHQFYNVKNWMSNKNIDDIICATDAGREGELIFRLIYEFAECTKPVRRLWISSMTDEAIRSGLDSLQDSKEYDNLFYSARCRAHADWLVGMNGSRVYSLTYDRRISVGRVQTPTLAILTAREQERNEFISEQYHELWGSFNGYKGRYFDESKEENAHWILENDLEKFTKIAAELKGKTAVVEKIEQIGETKKPPLLYDLTSLQRDANYYFSYSAAKTLRLAQSLYEKHKLITYPRTDSRFLSHDMAGSLKTRLSKLNIEPWNEFAETALQLEGVPKRVIWDARVTDHHAIIPTGKVAAIKKLSEEEAALFDLVVRRYMAVFFDDQELLKTNVITRCEGLPFESKGLQVLKEGWAKIYDSLKKKSTSDDEQRIPDMKEGDTRKVTSAAIKNKKTKPPARYTDATLLSAMENAGRMIDDEELSQAMKDSGLGTPATRAAIIERLIQVKYVRRSGKTLVPTDKGIMLISILPQNMKSPEMTGTWEKELNEIRHGEYDPDKFMDGIKDMTCEIVANGKKKIDGVEFPGDSRSAAVSDTKDPLGACPGCEDGNIMENTKAYYCTNWRLKKCKFTLWKKDKLEERPEFTRDMTKELLKKGKLEFAEGTMELTQQEPYVKWTAKEEK